MPLRVCLDEAGDELTILLWLYAAGAVNEMTVSLGLCGSLAKQVELCAGEGAKFARVESPTEVEPPAHHSSIGAGDVDKHPVELGFVCCDLVRLCKCSAGDFHSVTVFAEQFEPRFTGVDGGELAVIVHPFGDVAGLAAGRGAEIEHGLAGRRIEQGDGQQCAGILHVEQPVAKAAKRLERRVLA